MKIRPSLLAADMTHIAQEIASVYSSTVPSIHIDIGDNDFVPSSMLPLSIFDDIPLDIPLDVHLMVQYPSQFFPKILPYSQVRSVAFHIESKEDIRENISFLRQQGKGVGLAILHTTPSDHLDPYLLEVDYVLVMTVKGGFSGTPFLPEVLEKIAEIHHKRPELALIVDGGINLETAQLCANQ